MHHLTDHIHYFQGSDLVLHNIIYRHQIPYRFHSHISGVQHQTILKYHKVLDLRSLFWLHLTSLLLPHLPLLLSLIYFLWPCFMYRYRKKQSKFFSTAKTTILFLQMPSLSSSLMHRSKFQGSPSAIPSYVDPTASISTL